MATICAAPIQAAFIAHRIARLRAAVAVGRTRYEGAMAAKKTRARTERRTAQRAADKLAAARRALWLVSDGTTVARPLVVESASVIEPVARGLRCLACEAHLEVAAHDALTLEGRRLRKVRAHCRRCGESRDVYFAIVSALPS
jgi:hypothetical protein